MLFDKNYRHFSYLLLWSLIFKIAIILRTYTFASNFSAHNLTLSHYKSVSSYVIFNVESNSNSSYHLNISYNLGPHLTCLHSIERSLLQFQQTDHITKLNYSKSNLGASCKYSHCCRTAFSTKYYTH